MRYLPRDKDAPQSLEDRLGKYEYIQRAFRRDDRWVLGRCDRFMLAAKILYHGAHINRFGGPTSACGGSWQIARFASFAIHDSDHTPKTVVLLSIDHSDTEPGISQQGSVEIDNNQQTPSREVGL